MKGDTDSSTSGSQNGEAQPAPQEAGQGSSAHSKATDQPTQEYSLYEQAPPGYTTIDTAPLESDRQPLIGPASGGAAENGVQQVYEPRQLDADCFGGHFWLNVILTFLGGVPGLLHAWYIIAVTPGTIRNRAGPATASDEENGREGARVELI